MKRFLRKCAVFVMVGVMMVVSGNVAALSEGGGEPSQTAAPSAHTVLVNGVNTAFRVFNIGGYNFFMLRDIAYVLNGTSSQFEVAWDETLNAINLTTGAPYTVIGSEMAAATTQSAEAIPTTSSVFVNGEAVNMLAYNIGGYNFFRLRDLGYALGFDVDWDEATSTVLISSKPVEEQAVEARPAWQGQFSHVQSSISLPSDRRLTDEEMQVWRSEYWAMGGASEIEREVVRLLNIERQNNGLQPLEIDETLAMATRFHSQIIANADFYFHLAPGQSIAGVHNFGPYGGSIATARFFGVSNIAGAIGPSGAPGRSFTQSPQQQLNGWMGSPPHRSIALNPAATRVGVGLQVGESGQTYWYVITAR